MLMLPSNCRFRLPAGRQDRVYAVIARDPNDETLRDARFMTALYATNHARASKHGAPVFLTFADARCAMRVAEGTLSNLGTQPATSSAQRPPGVLQTREMTVEEAAVVSFDRMRMDLVVVYALKGAVVDDHETWDIFYAKRGTEFFATSPPCDRQ